MDNAGYTTLGRQSGLMREIQSVANNIANLSTGGFRKEGVIFAEHVAALGHPEPSLSMAAAEARYVDLSQADLQQTGGSYDFAIEGDGFFLIATPEGNQLTRSGAFVRLPDGTLATADGHRLLDSGAGPIAVPDGAAAISLGKDGTLSAGGEPFAQVGVFAPADPGQLVHAGGTRFKTTTEPAPVEDPTVFQGFLEGSNVNAVSEITRMIAVQRAYEMGQGFLEAEDGRIRAVLQALGR